MTRRRLTGLAVLLALAAAVLATATLAGGSSAGSFGRTDIQVRDDCDPRDPAWNMVGGCSMRRELGSVSFAEFNGENDSPLADAVVGHQAWRNEPSFLKITQGFAVRVTNTGGRPHTFTRVVAFGGGKVPNPALNEGLRTAPECPGSLDMLPGESIELTGLAPGNHRFMCCIHPWMRALVKVQPSSSGGPGGH